MRKSFVSLMSAAMLAVVVLVMTVGSASAAPRQNGLVNLNLSDNIVQIPIGIAANVCDVNAAVLAGIADNGEVNCNSTAEALAGATLTDNDNTGGRTVQNGLVNVNIEDNVVQVPIAAAANICDVNIAILLGAILDNGPTTCTADAGSGGVVPTPEA